MSKALDLAGFCLSDSRSLGGPDKIAQSLMHRHFATVCSRIKPFSPQYSEIN